MTGKQPNTPIPSPEPTWGPCPTCEGKGTVKVSPPETLVIRTQCRPRAGAPKWSDSPKEIAHWLGIYERFVRISIRGGYVQPKLFKGKRYYRLLDVQEWYEPWRQLPYLGGFFFESMLQEAFPEVAFVWDSDLAGYTVE